MEDWQQHSTMQEGVKLDIGFSLSETFYYGPPNNHTPEQYQSMRVPLYQPKIRKTKHLYLSSDILGNEEELERHYQDVLDKFEEYGKEIKWCSHFWTKPVIYNATFFVPLLWHDTFTEASNFLDNLTTENEGLIYSDMDQGWAIEIIGQENLLYVYICDPDTDTLHCNIKCTWSDLRAQAAERIPQVSILVQRLSNTFGRDYWTNPL